LTFGHVHWDRGRSSISTSTSSSVSTSSVPSVPVPSVSVMVISRPCFVRQPRHAGRWSTYLANARCDRQVPPRTTARSASVAVDLVEHLVRRTSGPAHHALLLGGVDRLVVGL